MEKNKLLDESRREERQFCNKIRVDRSVNVGHVYHQLRSSVLSLEAGEGRRIIEIIAKDREFQLSGIFIYTR